MVDGVPTCLPACLVGCVFGFVGWKSRGIFKSHYNNDDDDDDEEDDDGQNMLNTNDWFEEKKPIHLSGCFCFCFRFVSFGCLCSKQKADCKRLLTNAAGEY